MGEPIPLRRRPPVGERGEVEVVVDVVDHPSGVKGVLIQLPDSYVVVPKPREAFEIAALIAQAATALQREERERRRP